MYKPIFVSEFIEDDRPSSVELRIYLSPYDWYLLQDSEVYRALEQFLEERRKQCSPKLPTHRDV